MVTTFRAALLWSVVIASDSSAGILTDPFNGSPSNSFLGGPIEEIRKTMLEKDRVDRYNQSILTTASKLDHPDYPALEKYWESLTIDQFKKEYSARWPKANFSETQMQKMAEAETALRKKNIEPHTFKGGLLQIHYQLILKSLKDLVFERDHQPAFFGYWLAPQ